MAELPNLVHSEIPFLEHKIHVKQQTLACSDK
jgi:hypothetical protein